MTRIADVDLLANQLMSYFGDDDDASAISAIRAHARTAAGTRRAFRDGIPRILGDQDFEARRLVERCANRRMGSEAAARDWLKALHATLFGAAGAKKKSARRGKRRA